MQLATPVVKLFLDAGFSFDEIQAHEEQFIELAKGMAAHDAELIDATIEDLQSLKARFERMATAYANQSARLKGISKE
jgi:hypothetical protein